MNPVTIYIATTITVILFGVLIIAYWLVYPYQPFTFYTEKNIILTPVVRAGDPVVWQTDVFHNTNGVEVKVSRAIENGTIINMADTSYVTEYGRQTFNNSSVIIPTFTPSGHYHVTIYNRVKINPLRTILVVRQTEQFEVVNEYESTLEAITTKK